MLPLGSITPATLPSIPLIPKAMPIPTTMPPVTPLPIPITSQNQIIPPVVVDEICEKIKALKAMIEEQNK